MGWSAVVVNIFGSELVLWLIAGVVGSAQEYQQ